MIEEYSRGRIRINGATYDEDVKIIGAEVVPHWWRKNGHRIDVEDIQDILDAKPEILVVGTGYAQNVQISPEAASRAKSKEVRLVAEATPQAVNTFNRLLYEGKNVCGAFHLTC